MTEIERSTMKRLLICTALIAALATSACASEPELSLAQSKSPAQLLRTEAVSRMPAYLYAEPDSLTDQSVACKKEDDDPNGLYREWKSTADISLFDAADSDVDRVVDDLVQTFIDQGWTDRSLGGAGVEHSRFIWNEESLALLRVTGKPLGVDELAVTDEGSAGATIVVETRGPCVLTGGPDSDEVKMLERRE